MSEQQYKIETYLLGNYTWLIELC